MGIADSRYQCCGLRAGKDDASSPERAPILVAEGIDTEDSVTAVRAGVPSGVTDRSNKWKPDNKKPANTDSKAIPHAEAPPSSDNPSGPVSKPGLVSSRASMWETREKTEANTNSKKSPVHVAPVGDGHFSNVMDKLLAKGSASAAVQRANNDEARRVSLSSDKREKITGMVDRVLKGSLPDTIIPPGKRGKQAAVESPKKIQIVKRSADEYNSDKRVRERRNSLEAQADVASLSKATNIGSIGGAPKCRICGKSAYSNESLNYDNAVFHKRCFKCHSCGRDVPLQQAAVYKADVYHKVCYTRIFQKGGYAAFDDPEAIKAQQQSLLDDPRNAGEVETNTRRLSISESMNLFKAKTAEELDAEHKSAIAARQEEDQARLASLPKVEQEQRDAAKLAVAKALERRKSIENAGSLEEQLKLRMGYGKPKTASDSGSGSSMTQGASFKRVGARRGRGRGGRGGTGRGGFRSFNAGDGGVGGPAKTASITLTGSTASRDPTETAEPAEEEEEEQEEEIPADHLNLNNTTEFMKATAAERTEKYDKIIEFLRTNNESAPPKDNAEGPIPITTFACTAADLTDEFVFKLCDALKTDSTLTELNLENNTRITEKGLQAIADMLQQNKTLRTVKLVNTTMSTGAGDALSRAVDIANPNRNATLTKLSYDFHNVQHRDRCNRGLEKNFKIFKGWK